MLYPLVTAHSHIKDEPAGRPPMPWLGDGGKNDNNKTSMNVDTIGSVGYEVGIGMANESIDV